MCKIWDSRYLGLLTMGESLILNHCVYGVYSPYLSASEAPPMLKCPDYQIREMLKSTCITGTHRRPQPRLLPLLPLSCCCLCKSRS